MPFGDAEDRVGTLEVTKYPVGTKVRIKAGRGATQSGTVGKYIGTVGTVADHFPFKGRMRLLVEVEGGNRVSVGPRQVEIVKDEMPTSPIGGE